MTGPSKRSGPRDRDESPPPSKRRQQSTTTSKAIVSFFTPASKKEPEVMAWRIVNDSLLVGRFAGAATARPPVSSGGRRKIAAFDFDSTLITPASGKRFGRDATDWKWWHSSVPGTLRDLDGKGYQVVILSNQGGISLKANPKTLKSDQKRLADFKAKVSAVLTQLDLPISVYAATCRDQYRKPRTGMWQELLEDSDMETAEAIDLENSFFVGDAGGREAVEGGASKDFSCSDRDLAANVGIPFHTPEEYFLREEARSFVREFDPITFLRGGTLSSTAASTPGVCASHRQSVEPSGVASLGAEVPSPFSKTNTVEIVLFCGSPGAGKSTFYWNHLEPLGYARVNQDTLKTREKCLKAATALIQEKTSAVIDNTNADLETRGVWVTLAKKLTVPIRCVLFTAPAKLCEHNDVVRALNAGAGTNPELRLMLPKVAFAGFASRYREPKLAEGFGDIIRVDFEFQGSEAQKSAWSKYWL